MARNITTIIATWVAIACTAATPDSPMEFTIVPPSPEVASLIKYNNIDISPFSGQPNINLPIYTVREGSIELPISISYHGGGFISGRVSAVGKIGLTGGISSTEKNSAPLVSKQLNLGLGLPCGLLPGNVSVGVSNTLILKDFAK